MMINAGFENYFLNDLIKKANKEKYNSFEAFLTKFELNNESDFASVLIEYFELLMNLLRPDSKSLETLR